MHNGRPRLDGHGTASDATCTCEQDRAGRLRRLRGARRLVVRPGRQRLVVARLRRRRPRDRCRRGARRVPRAFLALAVAITVEGVGSVLYHGDPSDTAQLLHDAALVATLGFIDRLARRPAGRRADAGALRGQAVGRRRVLGASRRDDHQSVRRRRRDRPGRRRTARPPRRLPAVWNAAASCSSGCAGCLGAGDVGQSVVRAAVVGATARDVARPVGARRVACGRPGSCRRAEGAAEVGVLAVLRSTAFPATQAAPATRSLAFSPARIGRTSSAVLTASRGA